jgi:hypothetical protein
MSLNQIFTVGYQSYKKLDKLVELTREKQALLVDIRYRPYSKDEQWQADHIQQAFLTAGMPGTYWWVRELGNVNYNTGAGSKLWDPSEGVSKIRKFAEQKPVILLCGCWDLLTCHRLPVAALLEKELGVQVEHILAVPKEALPPPGKTAPQVLTASLELLDNLPKRSGSVERYLRRVKAQVLPGFENVEMVEKKVG